MEVVITAFVAAVFAAAKSEFSVNVEASSITGSIDGNLTAFAFCITSPSGDNSKFGTTPDKVSPNPKALAASDTNVSKLKPDVDRASPKSAVILASRFADCRGSTSPLKLCNCP